MDTDWEKPPGSYLLFAMVVVPYLVEHFDEPRDGKTLTKLFAFFEEMAASGDLEVVNLKKQYRTPNVSRWVEDLEDLGFLFSSTPHGNVATV